MVLHYYKLHSGSWRWSLTAWSSPPRTWSCSIRTGINPSFTELKFARRLLGVIFWNSVWQIFWHFKQRSIWRKKTDSQTNPQPAPHGIIWVKDGLWPPDLLTYSLVVVLVVHETIVGVVEEILAYDKRLRSTHCGEFHYMKLSRPTYLVKTTQSLPHPGHE